MNDQKVYNVLFVCGVSGSGKTFLANSLQEEYGEMFYKLNQYTTRPRRSNTENEYYYIDKEHFELIKDILFATTEVNGNLYGTIPTFKESENAIAVVIVNALGLKNGMKFIEDNNKYNINYRVLEIIPTEVFELREDSRDIEQETADLKEVLKTVPTGCLRSVYNPKNKPITVLDVRDVVVSSFNMSRSIPKIVSCEWVTCIHNSGKTKECNCSFINLGQINGFDESVMEKDKIDEYEDLTDFLDCKSYRHDRYFTQKL